MTARETANIDGRSALQPTPEVSLSRLGADARLDQLLERARKLLRADTSALLLVDPHARQLVSIAAKGLEEEVDDGFRISVGRGFAGRVAGERQPVALESVNADNVLHPLLLKKGVRSLLGVPIFAAEEVLGVLHVGTLTSREFTEPDVDLLQLLAERASEIIKARARGIDETAALALQRGLMPSRMPELPGVQLAARYVPGHHAGLGGDWYDVFVLPSGWLGVVIGDVSGHGLTAAVIMGRLRSALRAYALVCDDPAQALALLNQKMQHFEPGSLATALYAMLPPDRGSITLSAAGHLPPVMAAPGEPAAIVPVLVDPPLGFNDSDVERRTITVPFPDAAVFAAYTDGLVERRDEIIDTGLARLAAAIEADDAEEVCRKVMAAVGMEQPRDDIALLTMRRTANDAISSPDEPLAMKPGHDIRPVPARQRVPDPIRP
ncbi:PP2C family protein-serine/threonine phosphatase [Catenuloplanes indicus]|uniref:GAF domain-containing protein n=1 Tax=Catenuloplanes indicus TaxID=137267 RepID=A0AAE3VWN3_9ACTN|nr:GAF domain-containing SpoIIE family protein phosphatase [Catenuloplanes indicus]MDQ0365096.1 hypothetical protein [Catenuloplanes indicus]